jgi:hypothetical protein
MKGPTKAKNNKKGAYKEKNEEKGPTNVKMKGKFFFLLCKHQKAPWAYESLNPALHPRGHYNMKSC